MGTTIKKALLTIFVLFATAGQATAAKTTVSIEGQAFHINGRPTYAGRTYEGRKVEGLLMNSRMVQGIFDDENPETRTRWATPDKTPYDAEKNTDAFIAAMPKWRAHGLLSFTINLEGGSPEGYSGQQPWINSAFTADGDLKPAYMKRLGRILDRADELGMAPIVGFFYFGQTSRLKDEAAVVKAVDNATDWLIGRGDTHVLIEIANECDHTKYPAIIKPDRVVDLIRRVQERSTGKVKSPAKRLLVSTSQLGGRLPTDGLLKAVDFVLLHGNGVKDPARIREMVKKTRAMKSYRQQPILFNEDDHFNFDKPDNNFLSAVDEYASWGYFDFRMKGEGFNEGYQSMPANWGISSDRKKGFFELLSKVTGEKQ